MSMGERKLSGYLEKKKHKRTWGMPGYVKRWYVLRGTDLVYYDEENSPVEKGRIALQEVQEVKTADLDPKKHDFILQCEGRDHKLRAQSKEGMRRWVVVIEEALAELAGEGTSKEAAPPAGGLPSLEALNQQCLSQASSTPVQTPITASAPVQAQGLAMLASLEARIREQSGDRFEPAPRRVAAGHKLEYSPAAHKAKRHTASDWPEEDDEEEEGWSDVENRASGSTDTGSGVGDNSSSNPSIRVPSPSYDACIPECHTPPPAPVPTSSRYTQERRPAPTEQVEEWDDDTPSPSPVHRKPAPTPPRAAPPPPRAAPAPPRAAPPPPRPRAPAAPAPVAAAPAPVAAAPVAAAPVAAAEQSWDSEEEEPSLAGEPQDPRTVQGGASGATSVRCAEIEENWDDSEEEEVEVPPEPPRAPPTVTQPTQPTQAPAPVAVDEVLEDWDSD